MNFCLKITLIVVKTKMIQLHCNYFYWAVMHTCIRGIDLASFCLNFSMGFWNCSDSVIFLCFSFHSIISNTKLKLLHTSTCGRILATVGMIVSTSTHWISPALIWSGINCKKCRITVGVRDFSSSHYLKR